MKTNSNLTLYNQAIESREAVYYRTAIYNVAWENRKAVNVLAAGGNIQADQVVVFIPYGRGAAYLAPKTWQALGDKSDNWTLKPGDIIVRGVVADEITALFTLSDLKAKYDDVLAITSVDLMDTGSVGLWHWEIGAK